MAERSSAFGNYGAPRPRDQKGLYHVDIDHLRSRCDFVEQPLEEAMPTFLAEHYKNTPDFDSFTGDILTPNRIKYYPADSHWKQNGRVKPADLRYKGCTLRDEGHKRWKIFQVGPFTSNGCYDWWQFAAHDL